MSKPIIGFVGLGLLGTGFVTRLLACGYDVVGLDVVEEKRAAALALGAKTCETPAELVAQVDIIATCVTKPSDMVTIVEGENGILSATNKRATILVDHSTTDIATTQRLADALSEQASIAFVDAPVSGGPAAAEAGTLAIMAGGTEEAFTKIKPVMDQLGRFTHMGPVAAGQATKLVNQTLVLTNYCVMAEALRLAEAYGVDASKVPHALATGHAGSNLLPVMFERMIDRDWEPRGYARQILKDLEMLSDAASSEKVPMPMSAQALSLFRMMVAQGHAEIDGAAVYNLLGKTE